MPIKTETYYWVVYGSTTTSARNISQGVPEVVDANFDGIPDILIFGAYYPFNRNSPSGLPGILLLGKGDGTFLASTTTLPSTFTTMHPREVVQGDFNWDGLPICTTLTTATTSIRSRVRKISYC